uniref:VQ domain-containing protein n=1 Tax=Leersia perrieri TaxID=77586 RepID=A0A0D9V3M4_9ORYZ
MSTTIRGADHMTTRHGPPAVVKIIETVHIEADSAEFKSVVQRLTGKDAVAGGGSWQSSGYRKEETEEEAHGLSIYCSSARREEK